MTEINTPATRLEWFVKKRYRIKSDFSKQLGMSSWAAMAKYIGKGDKSVLGIQYLSQFSKLGIDIYWYLTGEQIDNTQLYRGEDLIPAEDIIERVENLPIEHARVLNSDNIEKAVLQNKEIEILAE